jgi:beta-galactosidase
MTRGAPTSDAAAHVIADDDSMAVAWGQTHGAAWAFLAQRPWLAGGFLWTGFDYRGEATPFGWPSQSSFFGAMDLCGFAKSAFHIRRALWLAEPVLTIWPHWTFPGQEGQPVPILVASNAQSVSLHLDGQEIAVHRSTKARRGCARSMPPAASSRAPGAMARWWPKAPAKPPARRSPCASCPIARGSPPIAMTPCRSRSWPSMPRAAPCRSRRPALRSPSPAAASSAWATAIPTWPCPKRPPAMAAARRWRCSTASPRSSSLGKMRQAARSNWSPAPPPRACALRRAGRSAAHRHAARDPARAKPYRMAPGPASAQRPVPGQKLAEGDMNSWAWTKPGATQPSDPAARWVLLHVSFTPRRAVAAAGGTLRFASLAGRAEIWLDGARIAVKDDPAPARCASLPAGHRGAPARRAVRHPRHPFANRHPLRHRRHGQPRADGFRKRFPHPILRPAHCCIAPPTGNPGAASRL